MPFREQRHLRSTMCSRTLAFSARPVVFYVVVIQQWPSINHIVPLTSHLLYPHAAHITISEQRVREGIDYSIPFLELRQLSHQSAFEEEEFKEKKRGLSTSYFWSGKRVITTLVLILTRKRRFYVVLSPFCNLHNYYSDIWFSVLLWLAVLFINISRAV